MPKYPTLEAALDGWRGGDQSAATEIYQHYSQRLLRLAEKQIGPRLGVRVGPDDIMLSVLDSVLQGIAQGQYAADSRGSLWNLVAEMARKKILKQAEYHTAGKRDFHGEAAAAERLPPETLPTAAPPEDAAVLADELERIRRRLKPADFEIFQRMFQGYSCAEIAAELGCARQTVRYKWQRIEALLRQWADDNRD
jgi:DNA-directed RNA polymerase specialized sigma24 family protein